MKDIIKLFLSKMGYTLIHNKYACDMEDPWIVVKRLPLRRSIRTIFDIGANVGTVARELAFRFPHASVLAFEPITGTFRELVENTAALPQVRAVNMAFGPAEGNEVVWLQDNPQWNALTPDINAPTQVGGASEIIRTTTLDTYCHEHGIGQIDLLKTDTEGFDLDVLRGGERMLKEHRITCIYSETGFSCDDARHTFFFELNDFLIRRGYRFSGLFNISEYCRRDSLYYADALFVDSDAIR